MPTPGRSLRLPAADRPGASGPRAARDSPVASPRAFSPAAFEAAVLADWSRRAWDPSGSPVLACVSGGADSIALLRLFHRLAPRLGIALAAVHVDHGLRAESAADADFVARACAELGVPLRSFALDPASRAVGESVEMWGRRERYARFEEAAAACGAAWILTAHHRDDRVETFFQRLGRGTGPRGLASIPFRRGRIARPLLDRPRAEARAYAAALGAAWREDSSNADVTFDRNWYRHRWLPALRARERDLDARVAALADAVAALGPAIDALERDAGLLMRDGDAPVLAREGIAARLREGDGEAVRYWLQALVRASSPPGTAAPVVTPAILREFARQWDKGTDTLRVQAAPGFAFVREKRGIRCVRADFPPGSARARAKKSCSPEAQRVILGNGPVRVLWRWDDHWYSLTARRFPRPASLEFPSPSEARAIFDANLISCTLQVRIRKDGDRFSPLGTQSRSRKLKTFFNEEKVPAALRDSLPVVVACPQWNGGSTMADGESTVPTGEVVAWIPGLGMSDFFKVRGSTTHILELVMKCENP